MKTWLLTLALAVSPAFAAPRFDSDWSVSAKSRARLVADGRGAGLEIELSPGAITYWRDPGEAGVPPAFDFSGSENLARAEVDFPAPERIPEPDGSLAYGYRVGALLPIRLTAKDPAKPVRLVVTAQYGVCEKICLPAKAKAELDIGAGAGSPFADALARARAAVPARQSAASLGATVTTAGPKAWRLCLASAPRALFVEAPEGFWIEAKPEADGRCFGLSQQQAPSDAQRPIALRLTIEQEAGAAETEVKLGG
jgi:DsbC/DsbD-like thiol-disulfide interchange protein